VILLRWLWWLLVTLILNAVVLALFVALWLFVFWHLIGVGVLHGLHAVVLAFLGLTVVYVFSIALQQVAYILAARAAGRLISQVNIVGLVVDFTGGKVRFRLGHRRNTEQDDSGMAVLADEPRVRLRYPRLIAAGPILFPLAAAAVSLLLAWLAYIPPADAFPHLAGRWWAFLVVPTNMGVFLCDAAAAINLYFGLYALTLYLANAGGTDDSPSQADLGEQELLGDSANAFDDQKDQSEEQVSSHIQPSFDEAFKMADGPFAKKHDAS
jgi:hypothetical protein